MKKRKIYLQVTAALVVLFALNCIFSATAYASDINSLWADDATRWDHFFGNGHAAHMGSKNTTYTYASSAVKAKYSTYITNGIALWGSYISCTESSSSPMGLINVSAVSNIDANAKAATEVGYSPSTMHIGVWTMTIFSREFDGNATAGKYRTIAHEIGHVYGLGHVENYSNQIMYPSYSTTKNVTAYDKVGMNVMTHAHTHNGSYPTAIEQTTGYIHKIRCTTCKAYYPRTCTHTDYHSGTSHYLVFNCECGNKRTYSWLCDADPCVMPFSVLPHHEIK